MFFSFFQTMARLLNPLPCLNFSRASFFAHTTHAQILLSPRYKIIPLYLNLATINLRVRRFGERNSTDYSSSEHEIPALESHTPESARGSKMLSGSQAQRHRNANNMCLSQITTHRKHTARTKIKFKNRK